MIGVLDYGAGNVGSIIRIIEHVGGNAITVTQTDEMFSVQKLVIPGVGSFDHGMSQLNFRGYTDALNALAFEKRIPILGICLGMQLMCRQSEEGVLNGLGWIDARVKRFPFTSKSGLRVPHMGWNTVERVRVSSLLDDSDAEQRFYFVHSYFVECADESDACGITHYGHDFVSAFERGNLMGVQFHPEKSHRFGMALFSRFVALEREC